MLHGQCSEWAFCDILGLLFFFRDHGENLLYHFYSAINVKTFPGVYIAVDPSGYGYKFTLNIVPEPIQKITLAAILGSSLTLSATSDLYGTLQWLVSRIYTQNTFVNPKNLTCIKTYRLLMVEFANFSNRLFTLISVPCLDLINYLSRFKMDGGVLIEPSRHIAIYSTSILIESVSQTDSGVYFARDQSNRWVQWTLDVIEIGIVFILLESW